MKVGFVAEIHGNPRQRKWKKDLNHADLEVSSFDAYA
jgi:hypothetical protein